MTVWLPRAARTVRHQLEVAEEILGAAAVIRKHVPELLPEGHGGD